MDLLGQLGMMNLTAASNSGVDSEKFRKLLLAVLPCGRHVRVYRNDLRKGCFWLLEVDSFG